MEESYVMIEASNNCYLDGCLPHDPELKVDFSTKLKKMEESYVMIEATNSCYYDGCLAHDPKLRTEFSTTLNILKGRIIPKAIVKRTSYLVCTCKKKHFRLGKSLFSHVYCSLLVVAIVCE